MSSLLLKGVVLGRRCVGYNRFMSSCSGLKDSYEYITAERKFSEEKVGVGIIKLNRPKALNALCDGLFEDLMHAANCLNKDDEIGCLILSSTSTKAFAAGADISEMSQRTFAQVYKQNMFGQWANVAKVSKPIVASVNGYALGGGCELAMMCDILVAGKNAKFGQPEINLGVIPGAGGTQRLVHAIGKSNAMHMILCGNPILDSNQALQYGLVTKVVDDPDQEALTIAYSIASKSRISVMMAKEAINASYEMSLHDGLQFERRLFHSLFATHDQKEGMAAFLEKRKPNFKHE